MPVVSKVQAGKMAIACYSPSKQKGRKIPRKVACEFMKASRGMKFRDLPKRAPKRKSQRSSNRRSSR